MRVLVDTNIILDSFLVREPFAEDATALIQAIESERVEGYVTATTVTDIFYIARRQTRSLERSRYAVSETLRLMEICPVDEYILEAALASNLRDFEDAVQIACAIDRNLDVIVTRNPGDFASAPMPILSAREFLDRLG